MRRGLLVFPVVFLMGCPEKLPVLEEASCEGLDCGGHGTCAIVPGQGPACLCDEGYRASGTTCVAFSAACDGITCGGNGTCAVRGTEALCLCDQGYSLMGNTMCVASAGGPCEGVTCSGHGQCAVASGAARCLCDSGYVASGTTCQEAPQSPCNGITCSGHGTCAVTTAGEARCLCDSGYVPQGATGCAMAAANPCQGVTCGGKGTCAVANALPICVCNAGYQPSGQLTCVAIGDACASVDCNGHGSCAVVDEAPVCTCSAGFKLQAGSSTRCVPQQKTLSFGAASLTVLEDARTVTVPLLLSEPPTTGISLAYTRTGTATPGSDFTALPATITLVPNLSNQALAISITNDTAAEAEETVIVTLTAPAGWTLGPTPTFTLTILDDESKDYGPLSCVQWGGAGDDTVAALLVDARQRVYVGGRTDGTIYATQGFNPGNSMHTQGGGGYGDSLIASYELDGGLRWGLQWGNFHREGVGELLLDPAGEFLYATSNFSNTDIELWKIGTADGGVVWRHRWADGGTAGLTTGNIGRPFNLERDPTGRLVVAATTNVGIDNQVYRGAGDIYVSSVAADGQSRWTRLIGSSTTDSLGGLALDATGNIYVCGTVTSSIDSQPFGGGLCGGYNSCGQPEGQPSPCSDGVVVKLSPTGQRLWTRQWASDRAETCQGLRVNGQGVVLAFGVSDGLPTLTRFDANGNRLGEASNLLFDGKFFLDAQDNIYFGDVGRLTRFDPTGTTVQETRFLLQPGQFAGISDWVLGPGGTLFVAGSGSNYCNAPAPPGTGNNSFWALYGPPP